MTEFFGIICLIFSLPFLGLSIYMWLDHDETFRQFYKLPLYISIPPLTLAAICFVIA